MDRLVTLLSFTNANFLGIPEVSSESHVPIICCNPRWLVVDIRIFGWFADLLNDTQEQLLFYSTMVKGLGRSVFVLFGANSSTVKECHNR